MGAFELSSDSSPEVKIEGACKPVIRDDKIIALKVYDGCRQQYCLTPRELGPARAAESYCIGDYHIEEGEIIVAPPSAANVTIDKVRVKKVIVVEKEPCPFKHGFWDVDVRYVFEYRLTFREADGDSIIKGGVKANSIFTKRVTLFGSTGADITISTDLFRSEHDGGVLEDDPFVLTESKAVGLKAEIRRGRRHDCEHGHDHDHDDDFKEREVLVTIGLFTVINLFRVVHLNVETKGFCVPDECQDVCPLSPCEFFESLDFPTEIFAPPEEV